MNCRDVKLQLPIDGDRREISQRVNQTFSAPSISVKQAEAAPNKTGSGDPCPICEALLHVEFF